MPNNGNGWRSGRDPVQRWLRILTTLVCLAVFVFLVVSREPGMETLAAAGLALGAVLLLLGYEGVVRLPIIGRKEEDDKE